MHVRRGDLFLTVPKAKMARRCPKMAQGTPFTHIADQDAQDKRSKMLKMPKPRCPDPPRWLPNCPPTHTADLPETKAGLVRTTAHLTWNNRALRQGPMCCYNVFWHVGCYNSTKSSMTMRSRNCSEPKQTLTRQVCVRYKQRSLPNTCEQHKIRLSTSWPSKSVKKEEG